MVFDYLDILQPYFFAFCKLQIRCGLDMGWTSQWSISKTDNDVVEILNNSDFSR